MINLSGGQGKLQSLQPSQSTAKEGSYLGSQLEMQYASPEAPLLGSELEMRYASPGHF